MSKYGLEVGTGNGVRLDSQSELSEALADAMDNAEFPDLKAIICAFTRRAGGADGIAKMLMREYRDAKPGTMIRSMILQMILQGSKAVAAKEQARDESMISDEDLQREVQILVENAQKAGKYAGAAPGISPTTEARPPVRKLQAEEAPAS